VNSELYDSKMLFPDNMKQHIKICFARAKGADESVEGYTRNQELQNQNEITYQQLKRIKNFFDNFKGNQNDLSYILNGGVEMKSWVDMTLRQMRENPKITKRNKMNTGMENQFIKNHEKKDFIDVRKSSQHANTLNKYDVAVTEALKRINQLISKI
jgi:hypothetical protein